MTIPGKELRESIARLGETIRAAKATAEEIKERVAAQQVTPVQTGQEVQNEGSGGTQGTQ
jgi:hypothetical protein